MLALFFAAYNFPGFALPFKFCGYFGKFPVDGPLAPSFGYIPARKQPGL